MPLIFRWFYNTAVISWIESIGSGLVEGGWGGRWVAAGGLKQAFKHKCLMAGLCHQ